jgi:hypothetical protein
MTKFDGSAGSVKYSGKVSNFGRLSNMSNSKTWFSIVWAVLIVGIVTIRVRLVSGFFTSS